MSLAEAVAASLVLMVGSSAAAQLWSQALRSSWHLARQEEHHQRLEALVLASEHNARHLASSLGPTEDCAEAANQLVLLLKPMASGEAGGHGITFTTPASRPSTVHARWETGGQRRERLLSVSALGLCQEVSHAP
jgi:hypothetical protein